MAPVSTQVVVKTSTVEKTVKILRSGGVGVLATDTIYGIVGSAFSKKAVLRIYRLRKRNRKKPMIILVSSLDDLNSFGIKLTVGVKRLLMNLWPGKVSVVLPCRSKRFSYLHRGTGTLAFRLPKPKWLRSLVKRTGPLVAPSANLEGLAPARTVKEAKKYFGRKVDFYVKKDKLASLPSTLIAFKKGKVVVVRSGAVKV